MTKIIGCFFLFFSFQAFTQEVVVGFQTDLEKLSLKQLLVEREIVGKFKACPAESLIKKQRAWSCDKLTESFTCKVLMKCSEPNQFLTADKYQSDVNQKIKELTQNEKVFDLNLAATMLYGEKFEHYEITFHHSPGKNDELVSKVKTEDEVEVFFETDKEYFEKLKQEAVKKDELQVKVEEVKKVIEHKQRMHHLNEWTVSLINGYDNVDRSVRSIDVAWVPFWRPTEKFELGLNVGGHFLKTSRDVATATESFVVLEYFPYIAGQFGKTYAALGFGKQQWFNDESDSYNLMALTVGYDVELFFKRVFVQFNKIDNDSEIEQIKVGMTLSF